MKLPSLENLPCLSGIYIIKNTINKKVYVGSAINLKSRWKRHLWALSKNVHHSSILQKAFNKYGAENFFIEILEYVPDKKQLIQREQYWIDKYDSANTRRNIGERINARLNG